MSISSSFELPSQELSSSEAAAREEFQVIDGATAGYLYQELPAEMVSVFKEDPSRIINGFMVRHKTPYAGDQAHFAGVVPLGVEDYHAALTVDVFPPSSVARGLHRVASLIRPNRLPPNPKLQVERTGVFRIPEFEEESNGQLIIPVD